ncbi:MAG: hypothetical protein ACI9JN_001397 [Bacteroidia bacterium]|jgi:hypothetical protein
MSKSLSTKQQNIIRIVVTTLVGLAFVFELIRDCQRGGDFIGYVNAGNAVLNGSPIYSDYLNTWPPFFAIFSVPLALMDGFSPVLIRLLWLVGLIISWYFIIQLIVTLYIGKTLTFKPSKSESQLWVLDWSVLLPFLFILRFVIDDLSNIQINSYLLLACLFVVQCHIKGKPLAGGIVLGLIISLKVYPIFLLFFLVYKRGYRLSISALATVFVTTSVCVLVFGWTGGLNNFLDWWQHKALAGTILTHKNQSIFPMIEGLLTSQSRGVGLYYNILDLDIRLVKKITFGIIGSFGLWIAWLFRKDKNPSNQVAQFAFMLAAIPLLSPLAWKYYFVFLFPLLFIQFNRMYKKEVVELVPKILFITSLVLSILSTDGLLGARVSDILEVYGCITWATIFLLLSYLLSYRSVPNLSITTFKNP